MHSKPEIQDRQDGGCIRLKRISEGAESHIYAVDLLGMHCILKRRAKKGYRIGELDQRLRVQRTRSEAKIIGIASSLGVNSPTLVLVGRYDICMSKINGRNLNLILEAGGSNLERVFVSLGDSLALLHNGNVAHGDYTPANVIVSESGTVYIMDFGLSSITTSVEEKALDLLLMKRSINGSLFGKFASTYRIKCRESGAIFKRLDGIERRGRYNTRTLITR